MFGGGGGGGGGWRQGAGKCIITKDVPHTSCKTMVFIRGEGGSAPPLNIRNLSVICT